MSLLSETLNVTMGAVTNLIDRLVKLGYVGRRRDQNDRRLVKASLTETGQEALSEGVRSVVETLAPAMGGIDREERRRFLDTAHRLIARIERQPRQATSSPQDARQAAR
jgi:DNA-binding MarR family transcriptional regulator